WNFISKSPNLCLLHRKVLNVRPLCEPVSVPSLAVQYSSRPSQPVRSLPLKKCLLESPAFAPARVEKIAARASQKTRRMEASGGAMDHRSRNMGDSSASAASTPA